VNVKKNDIRKVMHAHTRTNLLHFNNVYSTDSAAHSAIESVRNTHGVVTRASVVASTHQRKTWAMITVSNQWTR